MFRGFPKEGLEFLDEIITNNSKEWLDNNRDRYEQFILQPNKVYVDEMGEHLQILVPNIRAIPKTNKSLFKIYRDARYHISDPIKTKIGIIFWQGDTHRMQSSSFYMHYEPHEVFVATGIRNFKPPLLKIYREYIQNIQRRRELHNILEELKLKGYKVVEPSYKRYPRDFDKDKEYAYLALFSSMYCYMTFVPDEVFSSEDIIYRNFEFYKDSLDLHQWVFEMTLYNRNFD